MYNSSKLSAGQIKAHGKPCLHKFTMCPRIRYNLSQLAIQVNYQLYQEHSSAVSLNWLNLTKLINRVRVYRFYYLTNQYKFLISQSSRLGVYAI